MNARFITSAVGALSTVAFLAWYLQAPLPAPQSRTPEAKGGGVAAQGPARAAVADVPAKPGFALHGLVQRGGASTALIGRASGTAQLYRVGDVVGEGWSLARVNADSAVLSRNEEEIKLVLEAGAGSPLSLANSGPGAAPSPVKPAIALGPAAGPVPAQVFDDALAHERNRGFLEMARSR